MRRSFALAVVALLAPFALAVPATAAPVPSAVTSTCDPFGTIDAGDYEIQANEWNSTAQQCLTYTGGTAWSVSTANFGLTTAGPPATYPSIYLGCHWGACTSATASHMPIQVSKLASAVSSWSTVQPATGAYDVAYDIWFNSTATTTGQPDGTEVMIWLNSRGGVQPFGSRTGTSTAAGYNWDVWTGQQSSWKIISYVLNPGGTSFANLNVKALIDDAVSRGSINPSHYLIDAEAGFEIWQGGAGLATTSFSFAATTGSGGDTTPPSAPANLHAGTVTASSVPLSWSASTDNVGVTGYRIVRNGTVVGTSTGTSFTDTGLAASTPYTYSVVAIDAAGNASAASAPLTVTTAATGGSGSGCSAVYTVTNDWGSGFTADVTVTDSGAASIHGWTVTWTWGGDQTVVNMWNAVPSRSGNTQTAANESFNGGLDPGASTTFGFQASYTGANPKPALTCAAR
jgi:chitodextrinase